MMGLLLLVLVIGIVLFYLVGSVVPTLIHIGIGYFLAMSLGHQHRWKTVFIILLIGTIAPLFLRIIGLSQDLYFKWTVGRADIFRTLTLKEGDTLFVDTNVTAFEYKPVYASAPIMGGNAGVGFRWDGVSLKVDNIAESLAESLLTLDSRPKSGPKYPRIAIRISPERIDAEYYDISLKIFDQHGLSADYLGRIRRKHTAEPEDYIQRLSGEQGSWLIPYLFNFTLSNSYIWKPLASLVGLDHHSPPVSGFIKKAIQILPYKSIENANLSADLADVAESDAFVKSPWQLEFRDEAPNISCADTAPVIEGTGPLTVYMNGTLRRLNMSPSRIATKTEPQIAQLVVCGSMGMSVVSSRSLSHQLVVHKYDPNWRLISEEEVSNISLKNRFVSRYKDVGAHYLILVADKDGARTAYRIPKKIPDEFGFADKFSIGLDGTQMQRSVRLSMRETSRECKSDTLHLRCLARRDKISDYLLDSTKAEMP